MPNTHFVIYQKMTSYMNTSTQWARKFEKVQAKKTPEIK